MFPVDTKLVESLHDPATFMKHLNGEHNPNQERDYPNFLAFFQGEIEKMGWEAVLQEYVFKGDERADAMLVRLYAGMFVRQLLMLRGRNVVGLLNSCPGFLHPFIHLGFGVEFRQPVIIAEGLAEACCHDEWIGKLLLTAEEAAKASPPSKSRTLVDLLDEIRANKELSNAAHWDDGNKIRDGILARAGETMIRIAAQYTVKPEELEKRTAEMTNAASTLN